MVTGREATVVDRTPLEVNGTEIECIAEFPYLGSVIAESGRVDTEMDKSIAQASRAFFVCADQTKHIPSMHVVHTTVWI